MSTENNLRAAVEALADEWAKESAEGWDEAEAQLRALLAAHAAPSDAPQGEGAQRAIAEVVTGEVWAWLNRHDAPWSPSDATVTDLAFAVVAALSAPTPVADRDAGLSEADLAHLRAVYAGWSTMPNDLLPIVERIKADAYAAGRAARADHGASATGAGE